MKRISFNTTDADIFLRIAKVAKSGTFDGSAHTDYLESCRWFVERYDCIIILTRDVGYHTSGWWKNPDYERCYHLSISFPGGRDIRKLEHILVYCGVNLHIVNRVNRQKCIIIVCFVMRIGNQ